mmetsp:Transcript_17336/g.27083  ORF Transcript_17336/g.27083 Transcript_17336/m.27083 type:complete len:233 (-) Transcript_17336:721-1419(-)
MLVHRWFAPLSFMKSVHFMTRNGRVQTRNFQIWIAGRRSKSLHIDEPRRWILHIAAFKFLLFIILAGEPHKTSHWRTNLDAIHARVTVPHHILAILQLLHIVPLLFASLDVFLLVAHQHTRRRHHTISWCHAQRFLESITDKSRLKFAETKHPFFALKIQITKASQIVRSRLMPCKRIVQNIIGNLESASFRTHPFSLFLFHRLVAQQVKTILTHFTDSGRLNIWRQFEGRF